MLFVSNAARPVHVELRTPKVRDGNHNAGGHRLPLPCAWIVAQTPNGPEQQWRNYEVVQAQDASEQRNRGVEHIFGAADGVFAKYECADEVQSIKGLDQQQANRLPGKNQPALQPEGKRNQEISEIAEKQ